MFESQIFYVQAMICDQRSNTTAQQNRAGYLTIYLKGDKSKKIFLLVLVNAIGCLAPTQGHLNRQVF